MRRLRRIAGVALLSGLVLGTMVDTTPRHEPINVGGYQVLSADFHVHAFVGDGVIAPWMMQGQAARAGLDVVAITNHDQTLAGRLGRWAAERSRGPMILVGEEVTGRDFHLIAVGIEHAVNWNQSARAAILDVHAQGGVAIAAHPLHGFDGYDEAALVALDGVEAMYSDSIRPEHAQEIEEFYQRALASNPEVATIGSTDVHTDGPVGSCRTYLLARERSQAGVVEAIREGRTVSYCESQPPGHGRLRGSPGLVRLIEPFRDVLAPPRTSLTENLVMLLVWLSLVALALLGTRE
jgi:predicted metal-dependent phosphoesterase TrpH